MKQCPECNLIYEDNIDICPDCGVPLQHFDRGRNISERTPITPPDNQNRDQNQNEHRQNDAFEVVRGNTITINGFVAESNTQQFYQSKFTKFLAIETGSSL